MLDHIDNAKLLVVDDNPSNIELLFEMLQSQYEVLFATDGNKAIELAQDKMPNLILLDIMMPDIDGFETCKQLKSNNQTRHIPIIFLTAKTEIQAIVSGFELGAVDYITKPFNSSELLARVHTQLALQKAHWQQKELLHILSHDLVNVFSAISFAEKMLAPDTLDKVKYVFKSSAEQGIEVIDMVRKMLAIEEKPLDLSDISLYESIIMSQELLNQQLTNKQIKLAIQVDSNITVYVEPVSFINSVLNNLLTNAIKFSHPNSLIKINATIDAEWVVLVIQDAGIGIPPKLLKDIFNVHKPTSRRGTLGEQGTGFGMPLVQKFVNAYGGHIQITSDDHGTCITVKLKMAP